MSRWSRRQPAPEPEPEVVVEPEPEPEPGPQTEGTWEGSVCFHDGWFYPVEDEEVGPDRSRKLVWLPNREDGQWNEGGHYEFATVEHSDHFGTYGKREQELVPE